MTAPTQFATFVVDGHLFGVETTAVQEVIRHQHVTPVPLAPAAVGGLINLRGQVLTALDLRLRFGFAARPEGDRPANVVVRTAEGPVSLLVDHIGEVVEVAPGTGQPPPDTLRGAARELIDGAYPLPGRLLLALDVSRAVRVS